MIKHLSIFGCAFALLSACTAVEFYEPQPMGGERLSSIPSDLQGTWKNDSGERIDFTADFIREENFVRDTMSVVIDTNYRYTYLSDSIQLHRSGSMYVFNELRSNGRWRFLIARPEKKGIGFYYSDNHLLYAGLKGISIDTLRVSSQYFDEGENLITRDSILIQPTMKQIKAIDFDFVEEVIVKGQISGKDLGKICKNQYLMFRYLKDGTIYFPPVAEFEE